MLSELVMDTSCGGGVEDSPEYEYASGPTFVSFLLGIAESTILRGYHTLSIIASHSYLDVIHKYEELFRTMIVPSHVHATP